MRYKKVACFLFLWIFIYGYVFASEAIVIGPFKAEDRILILAPHPDDEAIGCAGIIQQALKTGAQVRVVYLTNGDHNEFAFIVYEKRITLRKGEFIHMGEVRRKEAIKAMKLLGLNENDLIFLGYPDFGTFTIFSKYWQDTKPYRGLLTRISAVPYKNDLSFGAPYKGESILKDLENVLLDYQPTKIFVSHPADVNVDHKAFYLFLKVALHGLEGIIPKPVVYPYLIHCVGWPLPRHYHPELGLEPPNKFLDSQINWQEFQLTAEQLNNKHKAILCYRSQTESSAFYLLSFARKNELFGDCPDIELGKKTIASKEKNVPELLGFTKLFTSLSNELEDFNDSAGDRGEVIYSVQDGSLVICINKNEKVNRRLSVMFYLFGYSYKMPFAKMPKMRIITLYNRCKVFDGNKLIKTKDIKINITTSGLVLTIPLEILGDPDYILTSLKAYTGTTPADTVGFREIRVR